jgi:phosphoglycolate phosphatase
MSGPRLAIFDLDGTLVDSRAIIVKAVTEAARIFELTLPPPEEVPRVIGLELSEALGRLFPKADAPRLAAVTSAYKDFFVRLRADSDYHEPLFDGVGDSLAALEKEGIILGIATGKARRGVDHVLGRHGLSGRFITIQTPDTSPGKPHPDMVHRALRETGAASASTVMIGDTTFDIAMARAANVGAIGVGWGNHPLIELRDAGAHECIDHMTDLLAAVIKLTAAPVTSNELETG